MMGYCAETHTHGAFMRSSCAEACEKADKMGDAKAPPFDFFVILLLGGFGYALVSAVRYAIQRDCQLSKDVQRSTLGVSKKVGPGKPNRSALGEKKRSQEGQLSKAATKFRISGQRGHVIVESFVCAWLPGPAVNNCD